MFQIWESFNKRRSKNTAMPGKQNMGPRPTTYNNRSTITSPHIVGDSGLHAVEAADIKLIWYVWDTPLLVYMYGAYMDPHPRPSIFQSRCCISLYSFCLPGVAGSGGCSILAQVTNSWLHISYGITVTMGSRSLQIQIYILTSKTAWPKTFRGLISERQVTLLNMPTRVCTV